MAHTYTLSEIRAKLAQRGSKATKIAWLMTEVGMTKREAESTYEISASANALSALAHRNAVRAAAIAAARYNFTMGVEIECSHLDVNRVARLCHLRGIVTTGSAHTYNHVDSETAYKFVSDCSINGDMPCEFVTPILRNLDSLKSVCEVLAETNADANSSCGLHVHIGASQFTDEDWYKVVCNYGRIEEAIDSFMPASRRGATPRWCKSVKHVEASVGSNHSYRACLEAMQYNRYYKVNLVAFSAHHTVEFRQHSGTVQFVKIENWIKFLTSFVSWSMTHNDLLPETSRIEDLPFIDADLKTYLINRRELFVRR